MTICDYWYILQAKTERRFKMKKVFLGIIIGFCLSFSITAYAQEIQSMIGKLVSGQFPVIVDGETLVNPAIVVEGTSYLPVRSFGEKMGYKVIFDTEGKVLLETMKTTVITPTNNGWGTDDWGKKEKAKFDKERKMNEIKMLEEKINIVQDRIVKNEAKMKESREFHEANKKPDDPTTYESRTVYTKYMELINADKAEIIRLTSEIEALEAQL